MRIAAILFLLASFGIGQAAPPRLLDQHYRLELIASEPNIMTPIGLAADRAGRLLVVESHTHQRPDAYEGPSSDRIRAVDDSDGDGRLDRWTTFADGFRHAMNLLVRADGGVYVVTRNSVELLRDDNSDGVADTRKVLIHLETKSDYPHNGLSGIALTPDGSGLIIALGENLGHPYRLVGSDGKAIQGEGGRGAIFQCALDGSGIAIHASGFWNPFSVCFDSRGRLFAVDNDPDASPPCRLLHIVPAGDYGFTWQYGRAGTHPLQSWDGRLPGTLPMVAGTGEAPTALLASRGRLWVTSWGEHRIECYKLVARGASFAATREVIVQGDADFRPTGMARAPDGSLYFGDWVQREYQVHQRGRIWRLTLPPEGGSGEEFPPLAAHEPRDDSNIEVALRSDDPFEHAAGMWKLSQLEDLPNHAARCSADARIRLGWLEAMRRRSTTAPAEVLRAALADKSSEVRLYAVRWIADERLVELRDDVARLLEERQPNSQYYLAALAAVDWLDHGPRVGNKAITDELLVRELSNERPSAEAHTLALRLLSPDNRFLTTPRLFQYLAVEHVPLRLEAVRSLALKSKRERFPLLATIAADGEQPDLVRLEAIAGLAAAAGEHRDLLERIVAGERVALRQEAERVLRLAHMRPAPSEDKPPANELDRWLELLKEPGDADAGCRLFFSGVGPRCGACHQHNGRGGRIGPDLTHLSRNSPRERIIASILQPSQEIAPHYQPWVLVTTSGKTHVGLRMPQGGDDGIEVYADADGSVFSLPSDTIEIRRPSSTSIMPEGLQASISVADLRDLVTFLTQSDLEPAPTSQH